MNAMQRLRSWPEAFNVNQATQRLDGDAGRARLYLKRWVTQGLIQPAGLKTGWYYNTTLHPEAPQRMFLTVLQAVYPGAVVVGASVLHRSGWCTQMPTDLHIAVPKRCTQTMQGVVVHSRSPAWYRDMRDHMTIQSEFGLPALKPAMALADLAKEQKGQLDLNMYDIPETELAVVLDALKTLPGQGLSTEDNLGDEWELI